MATFTRYSPSARTFAGTWQRQSKQSGSIEPVGASPAPNANHESSQVPRYPTPALAEVAGTAKGTRHHFLSGPLTAHCSGRATGRLPLQTFFTAASSRVTGGVIRPAIQTEPPSCDVVGTRPRESIVPSIAITRVGHRYRQTEDTLSMEYSVPDCVPRFRAVTSRLRQEA